MINDLDYKGIEFPVSKKDFNKIEAENKTGINPFCHDSKSDLLCSHVRSEI